MSELTKGFTRPAIDAAVVFRSVMNAMARPGRVYEILDVTPPPGLSPATAAVCLTLFDRETPVFLGPSIDTSEVREWLTFHTNAPFVPSETAQFALGEWNDMLPLSKFPIGTPEYPDRSATLVINREGWDGHTARLSGPGLKEPLCAQLPAIQPFAENSELFPLGLDVIFTCCSEVMALPRSTKLEAA
ncbi:MAG: phosphonate C-P lyase system protein PhnH [Pseudomonadota bacterium]